MRVLWGHTCSVLWGRERGHCVLKSMYESVKVYYLSALVLLGVM